MTFDFDIFTIDTKEPVIAQWALRRIENMCKIDENQARAIEDRLFTDEVIGNLLDHQEIPFLMSTMIRVLRPVKFKNVMALLTGIWKESPEPFYANPLGGIIAENDPETAAVLFAEFCGRGAIQFQEPEKWMGVYSGLSNLNADSRKQIADLMINAFEDAKSDPDVNQFIPEIMMLMWQFHHPRLEIVIRDFIRKMPPKASGNSYPGMLIAIVELLGLSNSEYAMIVDLLEGYPAPLPSEIKEFYQPSVSPEEMDNAIRDIKKRSYKSIHQFLLTNLFLISDSRVKPLWQSLLNDGKLISDLHKKKQRPYFYAMLLCAMTSALRAKALLLETLPLKRVALLLSAQVEDVPDVPAFVSYFKNADRAAAVACLTEALDQMIASGQENNTLSVIAELDYDELLEPLTRALCTEEISDPFFQSVFDMLVRFGEQAIRHFDICFLQLNPAGQMIVLEIISKIGGEKAVAFLEKHFDACMAFDRGQTLSVCEDLPCGFCLDLIRPKINKGQTDIDNAYMMISLLNGNRTPEVETLLIAYYQSSQDQARIMDTFESGDILGTFKPYVEVELKCGQCGDVNTYRVNRIIADKTQENYIAQEIECINCGQIPEFDITRSGNMKISMEMMRLTFLNSEKDIAKAIDVSPIEMPRFSAFGKEMSVRQAIETYKQRIEEEPDNAEYHIGLGNTYFYLDKLTAAAPYLERAIALDPDYIESYYTLAEIAEAKNDPDKALACLKKGVPLLKAMKFMKYSMIDPIEFEDEYIGFHNELLVRTGGPESDYIEPVDLPPGNYALPLEPFVREDKKIGRNDPCPCGSGKKYKKCCLNKS